MKLMEMLKDASAELKEALAVEAEKDAVEFCAGHDFRSLIRLGLKEHHVNEFNRLVDSYGFVTWFNTHYPVTMLTQLYNHSKCFGTLSVETNRDLSCMIVDPTTAETYSASSKHIVPETAAAMAIAHATIKMLHARQQRNQL